MSDNWDGYYTAPIDLGTPRSLIYQTMSFYRMKDNIRVIYKMIARDDLTDSGSGSFLKLRGYGLSNQTVADMLRRYYVSKGDKV